MQKLKKRKNKYEKFQLVMCILIDFWATLLWLINILIYLKKIIDCTENILLLPSPPPPPKNSTEQKTVRKKKSLQEMEPKKKLNEY